MEIANKKVIIKEVAKSLDTLINLRKRKNTQEIQRRLKYGIKITWKSLKVWIRREKVVQNI